MAHHINARSFLCNECPKAYNTASDLAQHQRTHDKGREFYCEECGMFFEARSKFNSHLKIHKLVVKQPYVPRKGKINIISQMFLDSMFGWYFFKGNQKSVQYAKRALFLYQSTTKSFTCRYLKHIIIVSQTKEFNLLLGINGTTIVNSVIKSLERNQAWIDT